MVGRERGVSAAEQEETQDPGDLQAYDELAHNRDKEVKQ